MENVIITPTPVSDAVSTMVMAIATARNALVAGIGGTGELIAGYAKALELFDRVELGTDRVLCKWYELEGKEARFVKIERENFIAACVQNPKFVKADGKPTATVTTYWARVKAASGHNPNGNTVQGTMDCDAKCMAELKTMINRILKNEEDGKDPRMSMSKSALMDIYSDNGGDLGELGRK